MVRLLISCVLLLSSLACQPRRSEVDTAIEGQKKPIPDEANSISSDDGSLPGTPAGKTPYLDEKGRDIPIFVRGEFNFWLNDGKVETDLVKHPARLVLKEGSNCLSTSMTIQGRETPQTFKLSDLRQKRTLADGQTIVGWEFIDIGSSQREVETELTLGIVTNVGVSYSASPADFLGGNPNLKAIFSVNGVYRFELCPLGNGTAQATLQISKETDTSATAPQITYQEFMKDKVYVRGFGRKDWGLIPDWELLFNPGNGCYERIISVPNVDENNNPAEIRHFKVASPDWIKEVYGARAGASQVVPAGTSANFSLDAGAGNMNLILDGTEAGPYLFSVCKPANGMDIILKTTLRSSAR